MVKFLFQTFGFDKKIWQDGWLKRTGNFQLSGNLCFIFFCGKSVVVSLVGRPLGKDWVGEGSKIV